MAVRLNEEMLRLLLKQNVAVIGTVSPRGSVNLSLKGVVHVDPEGYIYFFDLYHGKTRSNLRRKRAVSLVTFSVREFKGYQFKGTADVIEAGPRFDELAKHWKTRRRSFVSQRIIESVQRGYSHGRSESRFPEPRYLVKVEVKKIYNLVPPSLRAG